MATTSISITPQFGNNTVTAINCGTSSPRLGGTISLSAFPNLEEFRCQNNDITAISGYENNSNLVRFWCFTNKLTGSIPSLDALINLQDFRCQNQTASNKLTGPIPSLSGLSNLQFFQCSQNQLTGSIPSLSGLSNLKVFQCFTNELTGPIPSLNGLSNLQDFRCYTNQLTGSIPSLSGLTNLKDFQCQNQTASEKLTGPIPSLSGLGNLRTFYCTTNQLTGQIPSLNGLDKLEDFRCGGNQLTGFAGGSVPNTLGSFLAQSNQLTQSAVDAILSTFDATTRTEESRILNLGGTGNSAPSYTGGDTTTSTGSNFTTLGTTVTAAVTNHNHPDGSLVTITDLQDVFTGTFAISSIDANQFRYTVATNSPTLSTGTGTATMRRTTNANDGFRFYQNLARFGRLATTPGTVGFPWTVTVNLP